MAKSGSKSPKQATATRKPRVSGPAPGSVGLPKGFKRRKSIPAAEAHLLVARTAASMAAPPYICVPTGPPPSQCLKYSLDPQTGQYDIPPYGELMDCAACRGS